MKQRITQWIKNWLGLVTPQEFEEMKKKYEDAKSKLVCENQMLKKANAMVMLRNVEFKEKLAKRPYEFDDLLQCYSPEQINAWSYKIINHARNNSPLNDLLYRWQERVEDAIKSLQPAENNVSN